MNLDLLGEEGTGGRDGGDGGGVSVALVEGGGGGGGGAVVGGEYDVEVLDGPDAVRRGTKLSAAANLANSTIGAGILALPIVLSYCGLVPGVALVVAMGLMADFSLNLLTSVAKTMPQNRLTYEDAGVMFLGGAKGSKLVEICTIGINFGAVTAYVIILGDMIVPLAKLVFPDDSIMTSREVLTLILATGAMLPLALLRRINSLRYASLLSLAMVITFVVVVLVDSATKSSNSHISGRHEDIAWFRLSSDLFKGVPLITFAFACHTNLFPVLKEMPTLKRFSHAIHASTLTCGTLYLTAGIAGYVVFLSQTRGNLLVGYPDDSVLFNILRALFCLTMVLTYPLAGYPVRLSVDRMLFPKAAREMTTARLVGVTVGIWVAAVSLALAVPNVTVVFGLVGSTASMFTSYILPGLLFYRCVELQRESPRWKRWAAVVLVVAGVVLGVTSTAVILVGVARGESDD